MDRTSGPAGDPESAGLSEDDRRFIEYLIGSDWDEVCQRAQGRWGLSPAVVRTLDRGRWGDMREADRRVILAGIARADEHVKRRG